MNSHTDHAIVPREKLDFGLDGDIPRFWLDNDPFKTRFFDAMSTFFPEGERFFITCVRDFKAQITDPKLLAEVKDFTRQEGQHGMVHRQFNDRVQAQGVDVERIEKITVWVLFKLARSILSRKMTLSITAALEHMTALMAHGFEEAKVLERADRRVRAMYTWHSIEEVEHKAVAFDVMQKVAHVGYFQRILGLIITTIGFPIGTFIVINRMFKADGFGFFKRAGLMLKGLWWMYKPGGLYMPILGHFMAYFKPGFHPWEIGQMSGYATWLETFNRTGDPIAASDASMMVRA